MGKKATKAADNMYYLARSEASENNPDLSSREKAAEIIGIDRTRERKGQLAAVQVRIADNLKGTAGLNGKGFIRLDGTNLFQ